MTAISQEITWEMLPYGSTIVPVQSWIVWDKASPLEIKLRFNVGMDEPVEWTFARDLLHDAITHNRAGEADVQAEIRGKHLHLFITSPFGSAQFRTEYAVIGQYLAATYEKVPRGEENYDLDATITQIFNAESA